MRIYLDSCAPIRLFDDQSQPRVRTESEAVESFLRFYIQGRVEWLTSEVLDAELLKDRDEERRERALRLSSHATEKIILNEKSFRRAADLERFGYGAFDAMHLAAAEQAGVDRLLTTDDRFIRQAGRALGNPTVAVRNPVNWVKEFKP